MMTIQAVEPSAPAWRGVLQRGVEVSVAGPMSMWEFLTESLGLAPGYVAERVKTIFLNHRPVDDLDAMAVRAGDVVALGGAMPGLVGISMRRDSPLGVFREDITCKECGEEPARAGRVRVKLFNLVAREAGEVLLARGVILPAGQALEALADTPESSVQFMLDGRPAGLEELEEEARQGGDVVLVGEPRSEV